MARQKKLSPFLEGAQQRLTALSSIDPALDLGNGLTLAAYRAEVTSAQAKQDAYNALLSQADQAQNELLEAEKAIRDLSERMLAGVAANFGKDSDQYEMAGGVRKSERKRPVRKSRSAA